MPLTQVLENPHQQLVKQQPNIHKVEGAYAVSDENISSDTSLAPHSEGRQLKTNNGIRQDSRLIASNHGIH